MMNLLTISYWFSYLVAAFALGGIWTLRSEHKYHMETLDLWKASLTKAHAREDKLADNFLAIAKEEDEKNKQVLLMLALTEFFAGVARSQRVP